MTKPHKNESRATAAFLLSAWRELADVFDRRHFTETKRAVKALGRARTARLFGTSM